MDQELINAFRVKMNLISTELKEKNLSQLEKQVKKILIMAI